ncbi:CBN-NHR-3 protein, partial [Aphelenchoides avenae]
MSSAATSLPCNVCRASKAAKHYGSVCCSGCKGFFRRTVRSGRDYKCPYNGNCEVSQ